MKSKEVIRVVCKHLNWASGLMVPEAVVTYKTGQVSEWGGWEMQANYMADIMWVTRSNYATEIEIKTSLSDWRADAKKGKWRGMPDWISRFIYVVPTELGIPDFVPAFAGVWHVGLAQWSCNTNVVSVARAPRKIGKEKVPADVIDLWYRHLHCRYWHQKLHAYRPKADYAK